MSNWKDLIADSERYNGFTILVNPEKFTDMFAGKNIPCVQLHSTQVCGSGAEQNLAGFCGAFQWKNGEMIPLDGDAYSKNMTVFGYSWFENEDGEKCLDILVGNDW